MRVTPLDAIFELDTAFSQGDLDEVLGFYEDNASVVISPEKIITGKVLLREAFANVILLKGTATQLKTNVIESGNLALFTSRWRFNWMSESEIPMQRESIATTVFRKQKNNEWLIAINNSFGPAVLGR